MATNAPTAFYDTAVVSARSAEVPQADFVDGTNRGGSNACGIGVNTGNYDPKAIDFSRPDANEVVESGYIGIDSGANKALTALDPVEDDWRNVGFLETVAEVAPNAVLGQISSNDFLNRTGETVPTATWSFGIKSS